MIAREVLNQALNKDVLSEIISKYSDNIWVKTLINNSAGGDAKYLMVRPKMIEGIEYILCPVLGLFDEASNNEVGFAISVDQDYFDVYAYEHNHNNNESKVLNKLPHCIHKAVLLDGSDYSRISDEVKMTANIDSAILFINNYLTDQAIGLDSPFELFDNKLYQQLINRLTTHGNNKKAVNLRLESLLENYDYLDENDPLYENNLLRANTHLTNFLFGCEDSIESKGFRHMIKPEQIKTHIQQLYNSLFQQGWIRDAKDLSNWSGIQPKEEVVQTGYEALFQQGWIGDARYLSEWSGIQPIFKEEAVQTGYEALFQKGWISNAKDLSNWSGIQPIFKEEAVQTHYEALFQKGWISNAKDLSNWSGIQPKEELLEKYGINF